MLARLVLPCKIESLQELLPLSLLGIELLLDPKIGVHHVLTATSHDLGLPEAHHNLKGTHDLELLEALHDLKPRMHASYVL